MLIVGGTASNSIDERLAAILGAKLAKLEKKDFPDGEFKIRIGTDVKGQDVVIVQSLYNPQETHLLELLFAIDDIKGLGAARVIAVVPYLAYARQNKRFLEGEGISIETVVKLLNAVGTDALVTVRPHKSEPLSGFKGRMAIVEPVRSMAKAIKTKCADPFILSPDKGGTEFAEAVAKSLGCGHASLEKERDYGTGELTIKSLIDGGFRGKDIVIVDDMISGGGTIAASARFSLDNGAKSVGAAAVHMLMLDGAYQRINESRVAWLIGMNTIPYRNAELVDVSEDIAEAIRGLLAST
ncbi:MAG: ribose-phosphate pyrophosphokinase [Candidatus Micrarchaeota archaeon]|nr:ribose-phosphate pyrophosphokinase [Candidatus Micrarchaeota archaeon]